MNLAYERRWLEKLKNILIEFLSIGIENGILILKYIEADVCVFGAVFLTDIVEIHTKSIVFYHFALRELYLE